VAFGCSSGIELHWVDALTGEDLNRWFPLTAPCDYLYFLPPRTGIDSAKKLRLVSSQGLPGERPPIAKRFSGRKMGNAFMQMQRAGRPHPDSSDSMFLGADAESQSRSRLRGGSDHYRAVPLSDGYHLLFTDPASGVLCLGNDAPMGGPTKLLRKLWFSGPQGVQPGDASPVCYTSASDLRWGVRVVAAYGTGEEQSIWLFSVPPEVFRDGLGRGEQSYGYSRGYSPSRHRGDNGNATGESHDDWVSWFGLETQQAPVLDWPNLAYAWGASVSWPLRIRGQQIGVCPDLVDLAVHSGPGVGLAIWAISRQGFALTFKLDDGNLPLRREQRWVMRDGTIRESDGEDVEMVDADMGTTEFPDAGPCADPMRVGSSPYYLDAPHTQQYDGSFTTGSRSPETPLSRRWSVTPITDIDGDFAMATPDGLFEMHELASYEGDGVTDNDDAVDVALADRARRMGVLQEIGMPWLESVDEQRPGATANSDSLWADTTDAARFDVEIW
jgi:hypothetical protein